MPDQPRPEWRPYGYLEPARFWVLFVTNALITALFAFEMAVKLVARGPRGFAADRANLAFSFNDIIETSSRMQRITFDHCAWSLT